MAESTELTKLIRKSMGLPESVNRISRSDFFPLASGTHAVDVNRFPQMGIIHLQGRIDHYQAKVSQLIDRIGRIDHYQAKVSQLIDRIDRIERIKVREFQENDVYEVNKQVERLAQRISQLESDDRITALEFRRAILLWSVYMSIATSIFVSLLWWLYG